MISQTSFRNRLLPALLLAASYLPMLSASAPSRIYEEWVDEEVRWIITDSERTEFVKLSGDEQRDQFVEKFWARRDPTPATPRNEFKEEHYRRLAFSNVHFASHGVPGWKSDRGRIYTVYGPPSSIERHPCPASHEKPGRATCYPYEVWHYQARGNAGRDATVKFVDACNCGEYRREINPSEGEELP